MKKIWLLLFLLLIFPIKTGAVYDVIDSRCTNESKLSFRSDASSIVYRLTKVEKNDNVTYTIIFYNIDDDLYITDDKNTKYVDSKIENVKPGTTMLINIYVADDNYCGGYKAGTKIIKVPYYNKYYDHELCDGYENYFLCKEDSNVNNMTEEEFKTKMNAYIESLKENKEEEKKEEVENNSFDFIGFMKDYWIYMASGVGLIAIVTVTILIINKRRNRGIL